MKLQKSNLSEMVTNDWSICVPMYQRKYEWEKKRVKTFLDDLVRLKEHTSSSHYMGTMVSQEDMGGMSDGRVIMVIDGQQRITTVMLFLYAIRALAIEFSLLDCADVSSLLDQRLLTAVSIKNDLNYIHIKKLINNDYFIKRRPDEDSIKRFIPTEFDRESYDKLFYSSTPDRRRLHFKHAKFLIDEIRCLIPSNLTKVQIVEFLNGLLDSLRRMNFALIRIELNDSPQQIFESINFKGKPLTVTDLVRNHIIKLAPDPDVRKSVFEQVWKPIQNHLQENPDDDSVDYFGDFFRAYAAMRQRVSTEDELYDVLTSLFPTNPNENAASLIYRLSDVNEGGLPKYAAAYKRLVHCNNSSTRHNKIITQFGRLNFRTPFSLLMRLMCNPRRSENSPLSDEVLASAMGTLESYFVRRALLGETVKSMADFFSEITRLYDLENVSDENFSSWLKDKLFSIPRDPNSPDSFKKLKPVDDDQLRRELKRAEIYIENRTITRYALYEIEKVRSAGESVDLKDSEIEHVMPQSISQWMQNLRTDNPEMSDQQIEDAFEVRLHTLGNLTLTAQNFNKKLLNKIFSEKRDLPTYGYKYSNVKITKEDLEPKLRWNFSDIELRTTTLTEELIMRFDYRTL